MPHLGLQSHAPANTASTGNSATTLFEYYTGQGKPLPKFNQRFSDPAFAAAAQQAGVNQATYVGSGSQNNQILSALSC